MRDSHDAIVDRLTFERAHAGEERPKRRAAAVFPLSASPTCAGCGHTMAGSGGGLDKDGNGRRC